VTGGAAAEPPDWAALVEEGRALLGAMGDGRWTDFNAHDPGITILEAFAFALTDLTYRAGHPVADLVVAARPQARPDALLAGGAVTASDLRRVALTVSGVRDAWIEPARQPVLALRCSNDEAALTVSRAGDGDGDDEAGDAVGLAGVARVVLDRLTRDDLSAPEVARGVGAALHQHRGLGEDIDAVEVLAPLPIAVSADLEIDDPARADAVLLGAYAGLADLLAPPPTWRDAAALATEGWSAGATHDGPPTGGVRPVADDAARPRPAAVHLSDVMAVLSRLEGVRGVRQARLGSDGVDPAAPLRWSLPIPPDRVARFDPRGSRIRLIAGGGFALDSWMRDDLAARFAARTTGDRPAAGDPPPALGRDRALADHRPLRHDLPAIYKVAPGALAETDSPTIHARGAQLRAYLSLLDALLAGQFAQLAHAGTLLGGYATLSYPVPPDPAPERGELPILIAGPDVPAAPIPSDAGLAHRNRVLAHLLARSGEQVPTALPIPVDAAAGAARPSAERRVLDSRTRFLADLPRLTGRRGLGGDLLDPSDEPALLDRIRLKAGLTAAEGERLRLVEHILLRPLGEDDDGGQPLLVAASEPDPYSLQLSLVADAALRPAGAKGDDVPVLRVARAETPAHLILHVRWLDATAFDGFAADYAEWRAAVAADRRERLGFPGIAA